MDFTLENILIPVDHPCFEGHFPGHPVFPAVAQVDLLVDLLQRETRESWIVIAIRKAKFLAPIRPGLGVNVSLKFEDDNVIWRIFDRDQTYATGSLQVVRHSV